MSVAQFSQLPSLRRRDGAIVPDHERALREPAINEAILFLGPTTRGASESRSGLLPIATVLLRTRAELFEFPICQRTMVLLLYD